MSILSNPVHIAVAALVAACWVVFAGALLYRAKAAPPAPRKRDRASLVGLVLQFVGIGFVWWFPRARAPFLANSPAGVDIGFAALAVASATLSAWMGIAAVGVLGRQWSLTARLLKDHKLIMAGPYRIVRHPIYTALLGLILATGLTLSQWPALTLAAAVYTLGTAIRIRSEERLLREEFGAQYNEFARRVPALIPRLF